MSASALVVSANRLLSLGISVGSAEVVGRNANYIGGTSYPAGVGAMAGIIQYSLHAALEPTWTAIRISMQLNPLGQALFWLAQVLVEALVTAVAMQQVFKRGLSTQQATVLSAESTLCAAVTTFLVDAVRKSLA